jgi:hypothetical protein
MDTADTATSSSTNASSHTNDEAAEAAEAVRSVSALLIQVRQGLSFLQGAPDAPEWSEAMFAEMPRTQMALRWGLCVTMSPYRAEVLPEKAEHIRQVFAEEIAQSIVPRVEAMVAAVPDVAQLFERIARLAAKLARCQRTLAILRAELARLRGGPDRSGIAAIKAERKVMVAEELRVREERDTLVRAVRAVCSQEEARRLAAAAAALAHASA